MTLVARSMSSHAVVSESEIVSRVMIGRSGLGEEMVCWAKGGGVRRRSSGRVIGEKAEAESLEGEAIMRGG